MARRKWLWTALLALSLAVTTVVYANSHAPSYVCPITGEVLPCENCCPLNQSKQWAQEQSYICPITGGQLPCEKCCPIGETE